MTPGIIPLNSSIDFWSEGELSSGRFSRSSLTGMSAHHPEVQSSASRKVCEKRRTLADQ